MKKNDFKRNSRYYLFFMIMLGLIMIPKASFAQTILPAIADAFVRGGQTLNNPPLVPPIPGNAFNNFGADPLLYVKIGGAEQATRRAYFKFDLSSITGSVTSATLKVKVAVENGTGDTYSAYFVDNDTWVEGTGTEAATTADGITWNTQPAPFDGVAFNANPDPSLLIASQPGAAAGSVISFDLTSRVIDELTNDPNKMISVVIFANSTPNMRFHSREAALTADQPVLEIVEGTPPPPSGGLEPIADALVRGGASSGNNYGGSGTLRSRVAGGAGFSRRSYLKFDLSSITGSVTSATLKLKVFSVNGTVGTNPADTYDVYFVSDDSWIEGTENGAVPSDGGITWDTQPFSSIAFNALPDSSLLLDSQIGVVGAGGAGTVLSFDITSQLVQELAGDNTISIAIFSKLPGSRDMQFHSRESTAADRPVLDIVEGTIPSTITGQTDISENMGSCDFTGEPVSTNSFNASESIQAAGLNYTRIGVAKEDYLVNDIVTPQAIDEIVLLLYKEGIKPMLLIEHNPDNGLLGSEQKWFDIGAAFAERFRPNSTFLTQNNISNWGITEYQAINEPLFGNVTNFPVTDYLAATKGFADGVHSVDVTLQVSPGGLQEVPLFTNTNPYMTGIATMLNNGTLNAVDIHRYYDRNQPAYSLIDKVASHQGLIEKIKSDHGITADFRVWSTEYNARGGSDQDNAKDFVTATWDILTVRGSDDNIYSDFALAFRTYLPVSSNANLGMAVSDFPFLGNPKGVAHQMMANITKGFKMVDADEAAGVDILQAGNGDKMWVFHNRNGWSNQTGATFDITDIPGTATVIEAYRYDSWDPTIGSTGAPAPFETQTVSGSTAQFTGLATGETYMFIAKAAASVNTMPTVSITLPDDASTFVEGETMTVTATASGGNGIKEVVLYAGPVRLGEFTSAPYTVDWENIPAGTTTILAIAKGNNGSVRLAEKQVIVQHPAAGVNVISMADAYVKGGQTDDDNFGDSSSLLIKTANVDNLKRRIFLKFDVSTLSDVQKATLRLRVARSGTATHTVYAVNDDSWTESGITWNNQPDFPTAITNGQPAEEGQWTEFDVTNQVIAEQAGDGILSLALWTSSTALIDYFSKESGAGNEPRLLIAGSPQVDYEFPANGDEFGVNEVFTAKVNAIPLDNATVTQVEFFIGNESVGIDTTAPYTVTLSREEGGTFSLRAVATDSEGKSSEALVNLSIALGGTPVDIVADTYVRGGGNADNNFGLSDVLEVKLGGGEPTIRRAFLRFDLSAVDETIETAQLRLRVQRNDGGDGPNNISFFRVEDDTWDEEVITWNNGEPTAGDKIGENPKETIVAVDEYMVVDITEAVKNEFAGDKILSIMIASDGTGNLAFYSSDNAAGTPPQILLNAGVIDTGSEACIGSACTEGEVVDFFVTGRYGDNSVAGDTWEAAIFDQTPTETFLDASEGYEWIKGETVPFTITYTKSSGEITYTLGDRTLTRSYVAGLTQQGIVAFANATGEGNESYITDIEVNGASFGNVYAVEGTQGIKIDISSPADTGVTVSGNVTLSWTGSESADIPSFNIFFIDENNTQRPGPEDAIGDNILIVSPNPIGAETLILYRMKRTSDIDIKVIDVRGRVVSEFKRTREKTGRYARPWSEIIGNRRLEKGTYFVRLTNRTNKEVRKVIVN